MLPLVQNSCDILVEKLGDVANTKKSVDIFRYTCSYRFGPIGIIIAGGRNTQNRLASTECIVCIITHTDHHFTLIHRVYCSFTMETIVAIAFGRFINVQKGEQDKLSEAAGKIFTGAQEGQNFSIQTLEFILRKCI